jgi:hypothetical protein
MTIPLRLAGSVMLVFPRLLREPLPWLLIVGGMSAGNIASWYAVDNHKFLLMYWVWLCFIVVVTRRVDDVLPIAASSLVAIVFICATAWKLIGGEYINGNFLYWTFLNDPRLLDITAFLAGVPRSQLATDASAVTMLGSLGGVGTVVVLPEFYWLRLVTVAMSWATLIGEGCIGLAHAARVPQLYWPRHLLLLFFVCSTYFLLPVPGFAFALVLLGLAQCAPDHRHLRLAYLVVFALVHLVILPWQSVLA